MITFSNVHIRFVKTTEFARNLYKKLLKLIMSAQSKGSSLITQKSEIFCLSNTICKKLQSTLTLNRKK